MKITCPYCQYAFFASTRHVACQRCQTTFDVWGTVNTYGNTNTDHPRQTVKLPPTAPERDQFAAGIGAIAPVSPLVDEVLELPAPGPIGERASETSPILDASFSVLPLELLNRRAAETEMALTVIDKAEESEPAKRGTWRWFYALAAVAVIAVGGYYLSRMIGSVGQGESLTTVAAAAAEANRPVNAGAAAGSSTQVAPDQNRESSTKPKVAPTPKAVEAEKQPARPEPAEQIPTTRPRIVVPTGNFALQIAARPDETEAKKIAERIQDAGARARVVRAELPNRGTWYRVYVGAFETRAEAESYGAQLKRDGTIEEFLIADLRPR